MADSDITVSGLATAAGISYNALTYATDDPHEGGLLNQSLDVVEIWASQSNDRTTATKVAEGNKTNALHVALGTAETWFYWIKARNKQGYFGEWYPLSSTAGIEGTTATIGALEGGFPVSWSDYTPQFSASSGSFGSITGIAGRFVIASNVCFVNVRFSIASIGTAAGTIFITLPVPGGAPGAAAVVQPQGSGRRASDGHAVRTGVDAADGTTMLVLQYDGASAIAVSQFDVSLVYQVDENWTVFTSFTVTSGSGSLSSVTSQNGEYKQLGHVVIFNFEFFIADNGTGATDIRISLPVNSQTNGRAVGAIQIDTAGVITTGICAVDGSAFGVSTMRLYKHDGSYPVATGSTVRGTIIYEIVGAG